MDALAKVAHLTEELQLAKDRYDAAMAARDESIWQARTTRYEPDGPAKYGPGVIAKAAGLTPEHVRRICNAVGKQRAARTT